MSTNPARKRRRAPWPLAAAAGVPADTGRHEEVYRHIDANTADHVAELLARLLFTTTININVMWSGYTSCQLSASSWQLAAGGW